MHFTGDIFDEGLWTNEKEFQNYVSRFQNIFSVPKTIKLYVVSGNHDIGFHYGKSLLFIFNNKEYNYVFIILVITPYLNSRFIKYMDTPNIRRVTLRGNHFILINSMALEVRILQFN